MNSSISFVVVLLSPFNLIFGGASSLPKGECPLRGAGAGCIQRFLMRSPMVSWFRLNSACIFFHFSPQLLGFCFQPLDVCVGYIKLVLVVVRLLFYL